MILDLLIHTHIHIYIYIYTYTYIHTYIYIYMECRALRLWGLDGFGTQADNPQPNRLQASGTSSE